jgi:TatD DNase family protein
MNAGSSIESSRKSIELAGKYDYVYAAVGVHPQDAAGFDECCTAELSHLAADDKVKAIGEIGLDYYYEGPDREAQRNAFESQIRLALDLGLPVIIHDREAHGDMFEIVGKYRKSGLRGVLHCYSGSPELMREYLKMGFYIGFTGVITFNNPKKSLECLGEIPMDRILIETDCPYLAPVPFRGKRNDSRYLEYVLKKACEVLKLEYGCLEDRTFANACELFDIPIK